MSFTECNTVEAYLRDLLSGLAVAIHPDAINEAHASDGFATEGIGWTDIPATVPYRLPAIVPAVRSDGQASRVNKRQQRL